MTEKTDNEEILMLRKRAHDATTLLTIHNLKMEEHDVAIKNAKVAIEVIRVATDNKISWKNFWQIIGLQTALMLALFGYIANQMHDIQQSTVNIRENVASITGELKGAEITRE